MADAKLTALGMPAAPAGNISLSSFTLNQTTDQVEWIFQAPEAATITQLGFRYGARTGTPPTYTISLQGVTGAGIPDGTIKGGGSPASKSFTPPADTTWNSTWRWQTLDNSFAVARGDYLAIVIAYGSGTVDASNNGSFAFVNALGSTHALPYAISNDNAVRSRSSTLPIYGLASASKAYGLPIQTAVTQDITTTTEAALKFTVPATWTGTYQIVGVRAVLTLEAARTLTLRLYNGGAAGDTTVLQNVTLDTDVLQSNVSAQLTEIYFDEATLSTLTAGNAYRLSVVVDGGINSMNSLQVAAAADWDAWPGGQQFALSTRTGGNWTDTTTARPCLEMLLADLTAASATTGGGGLRYRRLR